MHPLGPSVSAWFSSHHGVARRADLLDLGVSRHQLQRLLTTGVLVSNRHDVFRLAGAPPTVEQRLAEACAVDEDVIVSHMPAGRQWGMRGLGADRRVHVLVPDATTFTLPGVVLHRCRQVDPIDVVVRDDGIRLTSPPRTVFDLASYLDDLRLESVIEQVLAEGRCTLPTLLATVRRLRARGRGGSARIARVLEGRPAWYRPLDSDLELRFERAIAAAGLPAPERQAPVKLRNGMVASVDFLWRSHGEAVEVDHVTWHGGRLATADDNRRDRRLAQVGVRVTRVTDFEIEHRLREVLADIALLLRASRAS
jgi:hypothetical protein